MPTTGISAYLSRSSEGQVQKGTRKIMKNKIYPLKTLAEEYQYMNDTKHQWPSRHQAEAE
jgi:hypothetical protein